jgi:hypothetical protein
MEDRHAINYAIFYNGRVNVSFQFYLYNNPFPFIELFQYNDYGAAVCMWRIRLK